MIVSPTAGSQHPVRELGPTKSLVKDAERSHQHFPDGQTGTDSQRWEKEQPESSG